MKKSEHRKALKSHLQRMGLKWTEQRRAIFEAFLSIDGHLTSEEVYRVIHGKHRKIGFSTVHRALRLFVEAGVASERNFRDGVTRYEVRQPHHDHLVCLECGKILEFGNDTIEQLQEEIARKEDKALNAGRAVRRAMNKLQGRST